MTFTTPAFIVFLAVVYGCYWKLKRRGQNLLILGASLLFYGWWDWRFLFLLFFSAGIDFAVALALMKQENPRKRRALLLVSLVSNLGVLGLFKYFNFFADSLQAGIRALGGNADPWTLRLILPIGISFYTFQALSYTIDVYRRQLPAVPDIVEYFSFITFFPHMVAGPIQQAKHFLVQFHRDRHFNRDNSSDGARQMLWGFFKKMVIADSLAPIVNAAYGDVGNASGPQLLWATYCFAIQIYCDFSGYTDIAIGCARLFDLNMTRNFAYPYFSRTLPEFWRRWHISLSTWFRDYLYIPLGGNRVGPKRRVFNVMAVFLLSGLWHGANWTFLVWGFLHGAGTLLFSLLPWTRRIEQEKLPHDAPARLWPGVRDLLLMLLTFHLVVVAWVFFRANSVGEAVLVLQKIGSSLLAGQWRLPVDKRLLLWIALLFGVEWWQRNRQHGLAIHHWPRPARWATYYVLVAIILLFAHLEYTPFIYFQF